MKIPRKIWLFAIVYTILSLSIEASLIIFGGLRVPENNAQIAPVILTIPAIISALVTGYKSLKEFLSIIVITGILTLVFTLIFIRITGISTGFVEPTINRFTAGLVAALITSNIWDRQKRE